jgi:hypothetical protein
MLNSIHGVLVAPITWSKRKYWKTKHFYIKSEDLMAVSTRIIVFWGVTACSFVDRVFQNVGTYLPKTEYHIPEDNNLESPTS